MFRRLIPLVVIALLGACASAPTYAPAASPAAAGYSERQIKSSRYFVTYRAAGQADVEVLQDFALLRAAELTLQNGRDWFWLDRRTLDEAGGPQNGPSIGIGIGSGSYGRRGGVNVGVGDQYSDRRAGGPKGAGGDGGNPLRRGRAAGRCQRL